MIVAIDPGLTTGYAVVDELGNLIETGNLLPEDLEESILTEPRYHQDGVIAVIEYTPIPTYSKMNRLLREVAETIDNLFPNAIKITPGVWKSSPLAKHFPWPGSSGATPHQKDAYRLGMYYLLNRSLDK